MFTACRVYGVSRVCSVYKLCRVHIVDGGFIGLILFIGFIGFALSTAI